ncbi:kinase-like domain-containing protein [Xylariales sp. AK1849]|nr:kinase-like domain-containing protein [Xylariales sp. AK1849]
MLEPGRRLHAGPPTIAKSKSTPQAAAPTLAPAPIFKKPTAVPVEIAESIAKLALESGIKPALTAYSGALPPAASPESVAVKRNTTDTSYRSIRLCEIIDGNGGLGGMDAGIVVVRKESTGRLFIQKNSKSDNAMLVELAKQETYVKRTLIHSSIVNNTLRTCAFYSVRYVDAYIRLQPFEASVYIEFCDRGTLQSMMDSYKTRKKAWKPDMVPECFVWHASLGLADALCFLQTGQSCISIPLDKHDAAEWKPIVHRDIKPDNVMLRSRDTPGSKKPLYMLLSDFGCAVYDGPPKPGVLYGAYGTPEYHAPELASEPEPRPHAMGSQAVPHSGKSDVFGVWQP